MGVFRKAERRKAKLRLAIDGPSGSGKTLSSLLISYGITGDWSKIAVIDTERGSGDLYVGTKIPGTAETVGEYLIVTMEPPFSPQAYCETIWAAEKENIEVLIIDSLSHAWSGAGGALDMVDKANKASRSGNSFAAWREVTPAHNQLIDSIIGAPFHVIATMRTKTAYEIQENDKGKKVPIKIGMAPEQRSGVEYEFTAVLDLSVEGHIAVSAKDRTQLFDGNPHIPSADTGKRLLAWLEQGSDPVEEALGLLAVAGDDAAIKEIHARFKAQAAREGWLPKLTAAAKARHDELDGLGGVACSSPSSGGPQGGTDPATPDGFCERCLYQLDPDGECPNCAAKGVR